MQIFLAYFHILLIMLTMGALISEHLLIKPKMKADQIRSLATLDLIYGITATLILITGLLRFFLYDKGTSYYLSNPLFHIKITLFLIIGLLSLYPTMQYLRWRKQIAADAEFNPHPKVVSRITMILRIELLLFAVIPLLAVMMARGMGF